MGGTQTSKFKGCEKSWRLPLAPFCDRREPSLCRTHHTTKVANFDNIFNTDLSSLSWEIQAYCLLFRPPRPDFQATQERLTRMGEREARGGREQFAKVKTRNSPHWRISRTRTCDRWSRTWRQTTWLPLRRLSPSMRAFSKDLPPITYLSDCFLHHSSI